MRPRTRGVSLAAAVVALAAAMAVGRAQQVAFVAVHDQATQLGQQGQWAEAAKVYGTFAAEHAARDFAPLAAIFQGVILRRELGQPAQARAAFERADRPAATPFDRELQRVARSWLARLHMETLDKALRRYYVHNVQYPEKLGDLVKAKLIAPKQLLDPWGSPFTYQLGSLLIAPKMPRQKYTLACTALQGDSKALAGLLEQAKVFGRDIQLRAIVPATPVKAIVTTAEEPARRITVAEGGKLGTATVARIAPGAVVLLDGELAACLTLGRRAR